MTEPTCHCGQSETADHTSDAHFLRRMATAYPPDSTWAERLKRIADRMQNVDTLASGYDRQPPAGHEHSSKCFCMPWVLHVGYGPGPVESIAPTPIRPVVES